MTLLERCQSARSTIKTLVVAQQNRHQRSTLRERTAEWNKVQSDWAQAVQRAEWIDVRPEDVPDCLKTLVSLRADAREAARRLGDLQDVSSLASDPLWTRLLQSTAKATEILREATRHSWRAWVNAQERPVAPATLSGKVPGIPANRQILAMYEQVHAAYERLAEQPEPRSASDAAALREAEAKCSEAVTDLSYDVPPAVETFFRAVDGRTATLASLTPETLQWLRDHDQLHRYAIRGVHA